MILGPPRIGLVVNPIAGLGGRVGLKGTDGAATVEAALAAGATPEAGAKARRAVLRMLKRLGTVPTIVTVTGSMGAGTLEGSVGCSTIEYRPGDPTSSEDTRTVCRRLATQVDLLLFAGGDGTARDVVDAVGDRVPALGIPAGVKIHSAAFAASPEAAGDLAAMFLAGSPRVTTEEAEVLDIDEAAMREGHVSSRLYGYLRAPYERGLSQGAKIGSARDAGALRAIASEVVRSMDMEDFYVVGPGTTTRAMFEVLGIPKTLLGVDVVRARKLVCADAGESDLLGLLELAPVRVVVSVIGGQGFVLGRGNQQISPRLLARVGRGSLIVAATPAKLASLRGRSLLVDTGDPNVDAALEGFVQVVTGIGARTAWRLSRPAR